MTLWATAVHDFGLTPHEAWRLTIPEYGALMEQLNSQERRQNYRAAMVVSAIFNVNRDPKKRKNPFTPEEILGEKGQSKEQTPEGLLNKAKMITAQFGSGKVKK